MQTLLINATIAEKDQKNVAAKGKWKNCISLENHWGS
jgi:hypothetical protein